MSRFVVGHISFSSDSDPLLRFGSIADLAKYRDTVRERERVREWYASFANAIERVMVVYAADVAKRERILRRINTDNLTVPWKRCDTHAFIFLYGRMCPLCLEDAHLPAM